MIESNQGIIHKVSRMYCDNSDDREDLFQDILVQLWTAFPKFKGDSKASTWMYRVALNTAISRFRKESKKILKQKIETIQVNIQEDKTQEEKEGKKQIVHHAISKLDKSEKAIIILYMDDYPYEEIAEIIGISSSNVGVKINRIKKKLKQIISKIQDGI